MRASAVHQPAGDLGRQISGDRDKDVPPLIAVAPLTELPHAVSNFW